MIHYSLFVACLLVGIAMGWLLYGITQFFDRGSSANRLIDTLLELREERTAHQHTLGMVASQQRTIKELRHELDQRNGWNDTGDLLSPVMPAAPALSLMEEYQPHVIEWLPFSLN